MAKPKIQTAPTGAALRKRQFKATADLFSSWLDMAEAALTEPSISPTAPHVRVAIAATAGIPVICWLQNDNTVGWKIAMPIHIRKSDDGTRWDVLFIDPVMEAELLAKEETAVKKIDAPLPADYKIDLNKV